MNKKELIDEICFEARLNRQIVDKCISALIKSIKNSVNNGEKVSLVGFGTFDLAHRKERAGRNPQTGESIVIPAHSKPVFKAGKWE
jgi:DNA-binding protein HU-beta